MTRIVLLDRDELSPGEKSFAQLILADEDVVVAGDHFVLRSYSPVTTIGGGRILDPLPGKHKRKNKKILDDLQILQNGELPEKISVILERAGFGGINIRSLAFRLGIHVKKIRETLEKLFSNRQAILLSGDDTTTISVHLYAQLEDLLMKSLADYHKKIRSRKASPRKSSKRRWPSTVSSQTLQHGAREPRQKRSHRQR